MKKKWIALAPLAILGFFAFIALGGWLVQLLWNWLMPAIFGWSTVTFWQALGLLALCRILFGGWSGGRSYRSRFRERMDARCEGMTAEEREQFRRRIRDRFGFGPPASPTSP